MTDEASKTRAVRGSEFELRYFSGRVIDIGCGPDLVVAHAEPFDLQHGDAQKIHMFREAAAYDTVSSSHCLEHMRDVSAALCSWWSLVRPGGYLVLVVPDEDLYEQGTWPSIFNCDHKATFRIGGESSWSPVSYDILSLVAALPGAEVISCERQDAGYDQNLRCSHIGIWGRSLFKVKRGSASALRRLGFEASFMERTIGTLLDRVGAPIDQTNGNALAQIQVVARKSLI